MDVLIHDTLFEMQGLGQKLQEELRESLKVSAVDLNRLLQSRRSLKCIYVPAVDDLSVLPENLLSTTILIGRDEFDPRVVSLLESGLADYVLSFGNATYLAAKIRSVARRVRESSIGILTDEIQQVIGQNLTEKERRLLGLLLRVGDAGANRQDMTQVCWPHTTVHQKTLDTHLFNLRRKLEGAGYEVLFQQSRWRLLRPQQPSSKEEAGSDNPPRSPSSTDRRIS